MKISILLLVLFAMSLYSQEEVWFAKGQKALKNNEYFEAINYFTQTLNVKPDHQDALYFRGLAFLYTEDPQSAFIDFSKMIELDSTNADAYNNRGLCNGYIGNIDKSIEDFQKAISIDKKFSKAYLNLGSAYLAKNDHKNAMEALNTVVKLDDKNPENFFMRGTVFYIDEHYESAIKDFTKSIQLGLKISKTYFNRANSYFKIGNYKKAIEDLTKVLELDSNDIEALTNRSIVYEKAGMLQKSEKDKLLLSKIQNKIKAKEEEEISKVKSFGIIDNKVSLILPEKWFTIKDTVGKGEVMIITKDYVNSISEPYNVGVRITFDSSMDEQYEVKEPKQILGFWEYNANLNSRNYKDYQEISRKEITIGEFSGYLKELKIQIDDKSVPVKLYEVILTAEDKMFYSYLQAPENQFEFYRKTFDKAIESIKFQ